MTRRGPGLEWGRGRPRGGGGRAHKHSRLPEVPPLAEEARHAALSQPARTGVVGGVVVLAAEAEESG